MGKPNPSFEKRAREQRKRLKRAEKAKRKAERDAAKRLGPAEPAQDEPEDTGDASVPSSDGPSAAEATGQDQRPGD